MDAIARQPEAGEIQTAMIMQLLLLKVLVLVAYFMKKILKTSNGWL
jgi:F0F1-type ATP synthase membrane subunit c/vacuolar-type H+-ATPase subunit K